MKITLKGKKETETYTGCYKKEKSLACANIFVRYYTFQMKERERCLNGSENPGTREFVLLLEIIVYQF